MCDRKTVGRKTRVLLCWVAVLSAVLAYTLVMADRSPAHQADDQLIDPAGTPVAITGKPLPAANPKVSEHNLHWLKTQSPQAQMEFLLGAAINHDEGATDLIQDYIARWHGRLHRSQRWQDLETTALYSNDLRVRAAAIEINLAVNNLSETGETVSRLLENGEKQPGYRPWSAWELGMLANRGAEPELIHERLVTWMHDKDQQTRFWAVEGLAHVGTERTIPDFLDVLRNDPSMAVRERAGCSLAKSGMLTREQRMKAVPGLLELSDDPALNEVTRAWVYQALREITDEDLPDDPATWRNWYSKNGAQRVEQFRHSPPWALLGNS
ncbi:MAG: HEAT repeat domain-containing protein [Acidobacteria bacterium]|nr:HEAT repeat domain-containing protein [Acidobacteriota bacterium]